MTDGPAAPTGILLLSYYFLAFFQDLEESHSEKHQKFMELKKREEIIENFLSSFLENKRVEGEKIAALETSIVAALKQQSAHIATLPTTQSDMNVFRNSSNQSVVSNSDKSVDTLKTELRQLNMNLAKVRVNEFNDLSRY